MLTFFSLAFLWIPVGAAIYILAALANWTGGRGWKVARLFMLGLAWMLALIPGAYLLWTLKGSVQMALHHPKLFMEYFMWAFNLCLLIACVVGAGIILLKAKKMEVLEILPHQDESIQVLIGRLCRKASWVALYGVIGFAILIVAMMFWASKDRLGKASAEKEKALIAAVAANPKDAKGHEALGKHYSREGRYKADAKEKKLLLNNAFIEYKKALQLNTDEIHRCWLLPEVAQTAFDAGDYAKARSIAAEMVKKATPEPASQCNDCNRGNSLHIGHLILGHVALKRKDVVTARKELLLAGKTPGSPNLKSFGPNMSLAKDLLDLGEREVVLQYFDECEVFWHGWLSKLGKWRKEVKAGRIPDFGANLYY